DEVGVHRVGGLVRVVERQRDDPVAVLVVSDGVSHGVGSPRGPCRCGSLPWGRIEPPPHRPPCPDVVAVRRAAAMEGAGRGPSGPHTRSTTVAMPMPPPMHSVTR